MKLVPTIISVFCSLTLLFTIHSTRAAIAVYEEQLQQVKRERAVDQATLARVEAQRDEALTSFEKLNGAFIQMSAAADQNLATANRCISSIESVNAAWRKK